MIRMCAIVMWLTLNAFMSTSLFATGTTEHKTYNDEEIKKEITQKLYWSDFKEVSRITVNVSVGEVTLEGTVESYKAREAAVKNVLAVRGVVSVINKLVVTSRKQSSTVDEYIKTRIINMFNYNSYLDIQNIHMLVDNGRVTLEGTLDAYWKKTSIDEIIGNIEGLVDIDNKLTVVYPEPVEDTKVREEILDAMVRGVGVSARGINIEVTEGAVTISGTVAGWETYNAIYNAVLYTNGVKSIEDKLVVKSIQAVNIAKEKIRQRVLDEIFSDARIDASQINISIQNGVVVLSGTVPTYNQRIWAKVAALRVKNVASVSNELLIKQPQPLTEDAFIRERIENILRWNCLVCIKDLNLMIDSGFVVMEGTVDAYWKKIEAEKMLLNVIGVMDLVNKLTVTPQEKISDKALARNLAIALDRKAAVNINDVEIRVNNGVVTLFGVVPSWQARSAAFDATSYTRGVKDIKNFLVVE